MLFRETTKAWVDDPGEPHFLPDGSFLFPSERSGWKHLYHYAADGKLLAQVTERRVGGAGRACASMTKAKQVYFTAYDDEPHRHRPLPRRRSAARRNCLTEKREAHRVSARAAPARCSSTASATR